MPPSAQDTDAKKPNVFRIVPSEMSLSPFVARVFEKFEWTRVRLITEEQPFYLEVYTTGICMHYFMK